MTTIEPTTTALSNTEQDELEKHESVIERGLQTFYEVGYALSEIREQKLYRAAYATFEDYCRERWNMSRANANRLVQAAAIADNLAPMGAKPTSERQVRPLSKLPPDEQQEAWREAAERSGGKPTARVVGEVVQERTAPAAAPEAESPPPPEKDAFENIMRGAMVGAEFEDPEMFAEEEEDEPETAKKTTFGLQPDFTYLMSPSEKRLCGTIEDQYGCTVRQVVDGQGRGQELWNATCEGVTIATTNTLKNMPVYIEQAIAWKSEYEQEMAKRGYHLVTMVGTDKARFAVDYLPKTESGGLQTVDLSLSRIAAIRKRSLKHQGAINIYLSMLAQDGHLVSAVNALGNPVELFAWLEQQGYQFAVTTWQAPPQAEQQVVEHDEEEEIALPDDWVCSKILHNEREWWRAYAMLPGLETNLHPTEEAAIRQAMYIKRLDKRFHELGWHLQHLRTEGWQIQRTFKGDNAPGEIEDFLYELERLL
jgi:hypothetical protein